MRGQPKKRTLFVRRYPAFLHTAHFREGTRPPHLQQHARVHLLTKLGHGLRTSLRTSLRTRSCDKTGHHICLFAFRDGSFAVARRQLWRGTGQLAMHRLSNLAQPNINRQLFYPESFTAENPPKQKRGGAALAADEPRLRTPVSIKEPSRAGLDDKLRRGC